MPAIFKWINISKRKQAYVILRYKKRIVVQNLFEIGSDIFVRLNHRINKQTLPHLYNSSDKVNFHR